MDFEAVNVPGTKLKLELQKGVGGLSGRPGHVVWEGLGAAPGGALGRMPHLLLTGHVEIVV